MIITANRALNLVSNHAVIQEVPELLDAVEAYVQKERQWAPKKSCGNCDRVSFFQPLEESTLRAIEGLSKDAIARLAKFVGAKDLYINTASDNGKSNLKQLH